MQQEASGGPDGIRIRNGSYELHIGWRGKSNPAGPGLALSFFIRGEQFSLNHEEICIVADRLAECRVLPPEQSVTLPWGPHPHQRAVVTASEACAISSMLRALPAGVRAGQIAE